MNMVLACLQRKNCLAYLDDIYRYIGKTIAKHHLLNIKEVFQRLREAGLQLKSSKCNFCSPKVEFLGHVMSRDGVSTDPAKTAKVSNWPPKERYSSSFVWHSTITGLSGTFQAPSSLDEKTSKF